MTAKFQKAKQIVQVLQSAGYEAMIVGGAVRDHVMGLTPSDFDIATNARPEVVATLFPKTMAVGKKFGVLLVRMGRDTFEVATFRRDLEYRDGRRPEGVVFTDAREDVLRRDFTINGLFWHPDTGEIVDYVEGVRDIQDGLVRCIGDPMARFQEDHLRVLRAVRFAANLDFEIEPRTFQAACDFASKLEGVSRERIRQEMEKILVRGNSRKGIALLYRSGLMGCLLPPEWIEPGEMPDLADRIWAAVPKKRSLAEALAWLFLGCADRIHLRDACGRFQTYAKFVPLLELWILFLKSLTFPNKTVRAMEAILRMTFALLEHAEPRLSLIRRCLGHPEGQSFMTTLAILGRCGVVPFSQVDHLEKVREAYPGVKILLPKPLLSGHDALKMGIPQDPAFKLWLDRAYDQQLDHEITSKEVLREWLHKTWSSETCDSPHTSCDPGTP